MYEYEGQKWSKENQVAYPVIALAEFHGLDPEQKCNAHFECTGIYCESNSNPIQVMETLEDAHKQADINGGKEKVQKQEEIFIPAFPDIEDPVE